MRKAILTTDGGNHDDLHSLITSLKIPYRFDLELVIITANGWGEAGPGFSMFEQTMSWFGRKIPVLCGSLYALRDYKENYEIKGYPQGKMYGRTIPEKNLFDISIMYSYAQYLPPIQLSQKVYNDNYIDLIMEKIYSIEGKFDVLSLGALTDVFIIAKKLDEESKLDKMNYIYHLGGGFRIRDTVFTVKRSRKASYNIYLDPDAASELLKRMSKRIYWITANASESVQFKLSDLKKAVLESPTPEGMFMYLIAKARLQQGTDVPPNQLEDSLLIWDVVLILIYAYPELIKTIKEYPITINSKSKVKVIRKCDTTNVVYEYNNKLAEMEINKEKGKKTNLIVDVHVEELINKFYEIVKQKEYGALCNLKKPLGCYKFEDVTVDDL